jgi:hypothetical protein
MKLRISIIPSLAAVFLLNAACSNVSGIVSGEEKSRMRNPNRFAAYRQQQEQQRQQQMIAARQGGLEAIAEGPAPIAEGPRTDSAWGGSLSPR